MLELSVRRIERQEHERERGFLDYLLRRGPNSYSYTVIGRGLKSGGGKMPFSEPIELPDFRGLGTYNSSPLFQQNLRHLHVASPGSPL